MLLIKLKEVMRAAIVWDTPRPLESIDTRRRIWAKFIFDMDNEATYPDNSNDRPVRLS